MRKLGFPLFGVIVGLLEAILLFLIGGQKMIPLCVMAFILCFLFSLLGIISWKYLSGSFLLITLLTVIGLMFLSGDNKSFYSAIAYLVSVIIAMVLGVILQMMAIMSK